jgi:ketosteroid isomerase-like protein
MVVDMPTPTPVDVACSYLHALEARAPVHEIAALLHPDAVIEVMPNALDRRGSRRSPADASADVERGRALLAEERYEIISATEQGDRCALEVTWSATLAVPLGTLAKGATMRARCSMHFQVRDGKIAAQRNYDCFDAW